MGTVSFVVDSEKNTATWKMEGFEKNYELTFSPYTDDKEKLEMGFDPIIFIDVNVEGIALKHARVGFRAASIRTAAEACKDGVDEEKLLNFVASLMPSLNRSCNVLGWGYDSSAVFTQEIGKALGLPIEKVRARLKGIYESEVMKRNKGAAILISHTSGKPTSVVAAHM